MRFFFQCNFLMNAFILIIVNFDYCLFLHCFIFPVISLLFFLKTELPISLQTDNSKQQCFFIHPQIGQSHNIFNVILLTEKLQRFVPHIIITKLKQSILTVSNNKRKASTWAK
ncbi:hypothetical protein T01_12817 [Trichinella spiralis]|uniref:Uncharacterized protein n=1 Tax=Trichinella spiralis TaxID=6334 RepID=A0A0V1B547_TRISP|nr:hypothetical protein T01_12817 [Trichinella spiralis]